MSTKLLAATDAKGCPLECMMSVGQADYIGAAALLSSLSGAVWLFADLGYDADWFRSPLKGRKPKISGQKLRCKRENTKSTATKGTIGSRSYSKGWRRVATRYDRLLLLFLFTLALAFAATKMFWL